MGLTPSAPRSAKSTATSGSKRAVVSRTDDDDDDDVSGGGGIEMVSLGGQTPAAELRSADVAVGTVDDASLSQELRPPGLPKPPVSVPRFPWWPDASLFRFHFHVMLWRRIRAGLRDKRGLVLQVGAPVLTTMLSTLLLG